MAVLIEQPDDSLALLPETTLAVDVDRCSPADLRRLTAKVRAGQRALDALLVRIGLAADRQATDGVPDARDAHATLLADGRSVRGATARGEASRSRLVAQLPIVGAAAADGRLGAEQLDAFVRAARGLDHEQMLELGSAELIEAASSLPVDALCRRLRDEAERVRADGGLADTMSKQASSSWRHWFDERTGMGHVHGEFDPERYEMIVNRVEQQLRRLANQGDVSKDSNLAATAAFELLIGEAGGGRGLPHLNVLIDWETFRHGPGETSIRETGDGHSLPRESISRLACDATVQRIVIDRRGVPVNVGRKHRTATDAQWQAMRAMYRACAWHGCDRSISWCQIHHVHEWEHGGPTDLSNLIPLCHRHHHQVHEGGWSVKLDERRRLEIHTPDGAVDAIAHPDRMISRTRQSRTVDRAEPEQSGGP